MIGALILGFVVGIVGRALVPRDIFRHMSGPASWAVSLALGLGGALLGYLIFTVLIGIGDEDILDLGGIIGALIGVLILLPLVTWLARRAGVEPPGREPSRRTSARR